MTATYWQLKIYEKLIICNSRSRRHADRKCTNRSLMQTTSMLQGLQWSGSPNIWPAGVNQCVRPPITSTQSRVQRTIFVNVIDCVVGAVVEQVCSGVVTCSRDNTRHLYPEMLYFYLKMHRNPFGVRAPLAGIKGKGREMRREGGGRGKKERGRTANVWSVLMSLQTTFHHVIITASDSRSWGHRWQVWLWAAALSDPLQADHTYKFTH